MREAFKSKRHEGTEKFTLLLKDKLCALTTRNVIRLTEQGKTASWHHLGCVEEIKYTYRILLGKPQTEDQPGCAWRNNFNNGL
jgi:hypothetical protein